MTLIFQSIPNDPSTERMFKTKEEVNYYRAKWGWFREMGGSVDLLGWICIGSFDAEKWGESEKRKIFRNRL